MGCLVYGFSKPLKFPSHMDIIDQANDNIEREMRSLLNERRDNLRPTGKCLNCAEAVSDGRLFCEGVECRDDYDLRKRREKKPA